LTDIKGVFSESFKVFEKALDIRSKKHKLTASNISNIDTPGYKAFDLIVENELSKISGSSEKMNMIKTHSGHLPSKGQPIDNITYKVKESSQFNLRKDGNTVDLDNEMASMAENSLMYNASAQILTRKFEIIKDAIKGGR